MQRLSARPFALALAAALGSAACSERGTPGYFGTTTRPSGDPTTLSINNGVEPEYLDPGKATDTASTLLVTQLFEGLTAYHPKDLRPTPGAAVGWEISDDGLRYRFHLRPGALWSDGAPVTARDFAYAWARVLSPKTGSRSAARLHVLKNGELFNLGRIKVASVDLPLCPEPRPCEADAPTLPKGAAARVADPPKKGDAPGAEKSRYVRVERATSLPFAAPPRAGAPPPAAGYVEAALLVDDPSVLGVRARDDLTLDVELERPTPYFINLTSNPTLSPVRRDLIERFKDQEDLWVRPEHIVVNGAYTLEAWRFRYDLTMKVNPRYRDADKIRLRRVVWLAVEDYRSTMNLYKTGELDSIGPNSSLPSELMAMLSTMRDFRTFPYLSTYWYTINTKAPPLDDERVRWALNLAIDKAELVRTVTRGAQPPATHYVPDFTGGGYAAQARADREAGVDPFSEKAAGFDPARARALLQEAGYPIRDEAGGLRAEGFPPVEILYNTSEGHRNIAVAIQSMWRANLGVSVSLRNEEWKVMLKNVRDGRFQIVRSGQAAPYDHPHAFLDTFLSYSPDNSSGLSDPEFDALLKRAAAAIDPAEGIRLYRAAEARAVKGMSRIPLYFYTKSTLVKPWVQGYYGNNQNIFIAKFAWIDPGARPSAAPLGEGLSEREGEPAYAIEELPPPGKLEGAW